MRWHFGCGRRRFPGWLNTDINVDLRRKLAFADHAIEVALGQHVIEHLKLKTEIIPLFRELRRVIRPRGELWLSTPDMEIVCRAYVQGTLSHLIDGRVRRFPNYKRTAPISHFVNELFHQNGEHKNLFDFELLSWALKVAGWENIRRVNETDLLAAYPDVWPRDDQEQILMVCAT